MGHVATYTSWETPPPLTQNEISITSPHPNPHHQWQTENYRHS